MDLDVTSSGEFDMIGMAEVDLSDWFVNPRREDWVSREVRLAPHESAAAGYPSGVAGVVRLTLRARGALAALRRAGERR